MRLDSPPASRRRLLRILVTSTPGTGHIHPLAPLAAALQSAEHDLLWATAEESCERVKRYGFAVAAAGMTLADRRAAFLSQTPEWLTMSPRSRRTLAFSGLFALAAAPKMRVDLQPVFDSFRPDVVIHEVAELAAAPMAVARGIPHVTVAFSGALPDGVMAKLLEHIVPIWSAEGLSVSPSAGLVDDLYLHPFPTSFGMRPAGAAVQSMRPDAFDSAQPADAPVWLRSLGVARPAIYLTSGTEIAALQAPWAAALEAIAALDVDAVATIGPHLDVSSLGSVPANLRVERFVPQRFMLERMSVVASHAGAGTMLASAGRGIPQLLFPMVADQWENADAVTAAGAAITLDIDKRTAEDFGAALQQLLQTPSLRSAATRVAAEIAAMPPPSACVEAIEALVQRGRSASLGAPDPTPTPTPS